MSRFAIGTQVDNFADDRHLAMVVSVRSTVGGSVGCAVDADSDGARRCFTEDESAFTLLRRGAA